MSKAAIGTISHVPRAVPTRAPSTRRQATAPPTVSPGQAAVGSGSPARPIRRRMRIYRSESSATVCYLILLGCQSTISAPMETIGAWLSTRRQTECTI